MVRILNREERRIRKLRARRLVGFLMLFFFTAMGGSMIFLSNLERTDKTILGEKMHQYNFRYEFRQLKNDEKVELYIDGNFFTAYRYDENLKRPILFPVVTGSGKTFTRGYPLAPRPFEPTDHPYHMGIWFSHGDVNDLDFWSNADSIPAERQFHYGIIRHQAFNKIQSGDDKGVLETQSTWERPDGRVLLEETTKFVFTSVPNLWVIDRYTTLAAKEIGVLFEDSKEGMYCIRVASELEQPSAEQRDYLDENLVPVQENKLHKPEAKGLYENSEGETGDAVWGKRAKWVKLSSVMDGSAVSVIMFDHPSNPNYPTFWMARGYGLFGANPFGGKDYTGGKESLNFFLGSEKSVKFRYRMIFCDGISLHKGEVQHMFEKYLSENEN
jgi:hypothetical protein